MPKPWILHTLRWLAVVAPAYWMLRCLGLWLFPSVFGGLPVLDGVSRVLLVEVAVACFGVTLVGGLLTGLAAGWGPRTRGGLCLGCFAALGPIAFALVGTGLAIEYLLILGGHVASLLWTTRGEPAFHTLARIAAPMLLVVGAALLSLLPAVPELGVGSELLLGREVTPSTGAWPREPWRPLAFGVVYFGSLVAMEFELLRRRPREWAEGDAVLAEPGLASSMR